MKLALVVIPAYNEDSQIEPLLGQIKEITDIDIVVVNDGSTDKTLEVCKNLNVKCLSHLINLGYGAAVRTGFAYAKKHPNYKYIVTMDGDGQHTVDQLKLLLEECKKNQLDLIVGRRVRKEQMPISRKAINALADLFFWALSGKYFVDTQSGLEAIRLNSLYDLELNSVDYELCTEILLKYSKKKCKIGWVDIEALYSEYSLNKPVKQRVINALSMVINLLKIST